MNKRLIRNYTRVVFSLLFGFLYFPHLLCYCFGHNKKAIDCDIIANRSFLSLSLPNLILLISLLHCNAYFRTLFYYRVGPIISVTFSWYRPGDKYFIIPWSSSIGPGVKLNHPYSTVLNAHEIGCNFSCGNNTTIGLKESGERPRIGNNVKVGVNCVIIGDIKIGDNVTIGAGSVVVKDVPDNGIAVGNPAKVIKYKL